MNLDSKAISYEEVLVIVAAFYRKAIDDLLIGYHFDEVKKHLDEHVGRVADFWQLQLTGDMSHPESLPFKIIPLHRSRKIKLGELNRWIVLFEQTLNEFDSDLEKYKGLKVKWSESIQEFKAVFLGKVI